MPLQGTLEADFSEFVTECAKAVDGLKALTAQAATTTEALGKMGEGKSPAVDKVRDLDKELKKIPSAFDQISKAAAAMGIVVTLEKAITLVVDFWQETIKVADGFKNIADQTGLAASEVSKLDQVAKGAGLQVEDLAKASAKLQSALETDKGQTALGRLGIDARELKAADPYTQLQMVATGLGQIQDRSERLLYQQDLLGTNSTKLARIMNDTFAESADAARSASDASIEAVAALGNAFNNAKTTLINFGIEGLGSVLNAIRDFQALDWSEVLRAGALATTTAEMVANLRLLREQKEALEIMSGKGPKPWELPGAMDAGPTHEQLTQAAAARRKLEADQASEWESIVNANVKSSNEIAEAIARVTEARRGSFAVLQSMTYATRAQVEADLKFGSSQDDIAKALGLTKTQVAAVADELERQKKSAEAVAAANKIVTEATTQFYQDAANNAATSMQQQKLAIGSWQADTLLKLAATGEANEAMYAAIIAVAEQRLAQVGIHWDTLRDGSIQTLREQYEGAEATYQKMLAASDAYTPKAIANAKAERDARLAALAEVDSAYDRMYGEWERRQTAFVEAITKHDQDRATAAGAAADAESAALDHAIAYAQAYGVSLDAAKAALGQTVDEAEQLPPVMDQAAAGTQRAVVHMQHLASAARDANEQARAGAALFKAYIDAGIATSESFSMGGYQFKQLQKTGVPGGYAGTHFANTGSPEYLAMRDAWGTPRSNTLTVNVNNADAREISRSLVDEMRYQGVRF